MNAAPLLDTHIWLWWLLGDSSLKGKEKSSLDEFDSQTRPFLCDVSIWEAALAAAAQAHGLRLATRGDRIRKSRLVALWKPSI